MNDAADRASIDLTLDAKWRVQDPARARADTSIWIEREAMALTRHDGDAQGRAEIRAALTRAGLGDLLRDQLQATGGARGFLNGCAIGLLIGGVLFASGRALGGW